MSWRSDNRRDPDRSFSAFVFLLCELSSNACLQLPLQVVYFIMPRGRANLSEPSVDNDVISKIGKGLMVLVGIGTGSVSLLPFCSSFFFQSR